MHYAIDTHLYIPKGGVALALPINHPQKCYKEDHQCEMKVLRNHDSVLRGKYFFFCFFFVYNNSVIIDKDTCT